MNSIKNQITSRKNIIAIKCYNQAGCDELVACRVVRLFIGCLPVVYWFLQKHMLTTRLWRRSTVAAIAKFTGFPKGLLLLLLKFYFFLGTGCDFGDIESWIQRGDLLIRGCSSYLARSSCFCYRGPSWKEQRLLLLLLNWRFWLSLPL